MNAMTIKDLPEVPTGWNDALERAALRLKSEMADWEKHFKDRMSFDEYKLRQWLNEQLSEGRMDTPFAFDLIKKYRSTHAYTKEREKEVV